MVSTKEFLEKYGVSMNDALNFVVQNLSSPQKIIDTCVAYQVTNSDLAEIVKSRFGNVTAKDVISFFKSIQLDSSILDVVGVRSIKKTNTFPFYQDKENSFIIYPNPSDTYAFITFNNNTFEESTFDFNNIQIYKSHIKWAF